MAFRELGPYRIEARIGTGGMGEVYRAYDARLDRRVALKLIRPEALETAKARQRFRREARAAAALSHPSVVQIHDILEREAGDCIVMELVEGESLARVLRRGPLPLGEAVHLGRQIAEGLAAAHARGIIHRDLKAENVMVTRDGHAKILDFGLAKSVLPTAPEITLSIEGKILGTGHAMSPEQAQGSPVDHRSDLFSLGSLLYEMFTGRAPFRRPTLAETLTWVCVKVQPPAHQLNREVPEPVSDLIDHLLQKEPELRPQSAGDVASTLAVLEGTVSAVLEPPAGETTLLELPRPQSRSSLPAVTAEPAPPRRRLGFAAVALLAALAAAGAYLLWGRPTGGEPIHVAVTATEVGTEGGVRELDLVASGVRVALLQGLLSLEEVTALAPDQVDAVRGTSAEVARAVAADEVIASRLDCTARNCQVSLSRIAGEAGTLIATDSLDVPPEDLLLLSTMVTQRLRGLYGGYRTRRGVPEFEVGEEDYEEYLRLLRALADRREGVGLERLREQAVRVRASSPRFLPAYLLEATIARFDFQASHDPRDIERAFEIIAAARGLAPRDPQPLFVFVDTALDAGRLAEAASALDELETLVPGDTRILARRADLLERQGEAAEALELMGTVTDRQPSISHLFRLATMEIRQGRYEAAHGHLDLLLERYPEHFRARSTLAQLELVNGSPARAVEIYEGLVALAGGNTERINLGVAYLVEERYDDAAAAFERVLEAEPRSPFAVLNLADAELLRGREEEAKALYRRLVELIEDDPAAGEPQFLTMRAQALAHLGERRRAVALAQSALEAAPSNPQVVFEAAVVYAVTGETLSALNQVEKARRLGVEAVWFSFPWFDPLRQDPDFRALFAPAPPAA